MSQKTTSLDIQKGKKSTLDISHIFTLTETRTLDLARHGQFIDAIGSSDSLIEPINLYRQVKLRVNPLGTTRAIDLAPCEGHTGTRGIVRNLIDPIGVQRGAKLRISRFHATRTLDIALPAVIDAMRWQRGLPDMAPRPRAINLVPTLYVPYDSIDIRLELPIAKTGTYPDLFARKLPYTLIGRRLAKTSGLIYRKHRKQMLLTMLALFVFSAPMLTYVAYAVAHGYSTLEGLAEIRDPQMFRTMIRSARGDFERSSFLFAPFSWIPIDQVDTVRRATMGGLALTRGLDMIAQELPIGTATGTLSSKKEQDPLSYRVAARDIFPLEMLGVTNPTDWIATHRDILERSRDELVSAGKMYAGVVPTGERTSKMQKIGQTLSSLANLLTWSLDNEENIQNMLGHVNPQRYLIFNQNRDEIRANGGFPGSVISFTLYKGNVLDYRGDDVYYYDWNLYPYKEIPPPGISLLTDTYGLRDVNYYPDFHDTLEKANSFIERSGDATVTTGIAIHQGIIEDILTVTGPVSLSGMTVQFDSQNFSLLMSTLVENMYARETTSKDILFRFITALSHKIQEKNAYLDVLNILENYRKNGEILFVSRDPKVDEFLSTYQKKLPWELSAPNWIYPVWTSLSGNKSDRYMSRTYQATTKKIDACRYINTVTLGTKHMYTKNDADQLKTYFKIFGITDPAEQAKLDYIQGNARNKAFVRVYAPPGATLVGSGSDIITTTDQHSTIFSLMMETAVGASTSKTWQYTLDIPHCENYDGTIAWTRQPGLKEVVVK